MIKVKFKFQIIIGLKTIEYKFQIKVKLKTIK